MYKINSGISVKGLLAKYMLKALLSDIIICAALLLLFSELIYKLDIETETGGLCVYLILPVCSFLSSLIAVWGMKGNIILFSVLSQTGLIALSLIIGIVNHESSVTIIAKIILIVIFSAISAVIAARRK